MTGRERGSMMVRALCVDAVWNFRRHQNVGFLFMIIPALQRRWKDHDQLAAALKRHTRYISTHPAMITALGGWVVRHEERLRDEPDVSAQEGHRLKGLMMGPLAALGDALFWSALKPVLLLGGVACVVMANDPLWKISGCVVAVAAYNVIRLSVMWEGLVVGYERGISAVAAFQRVPVWVNQIQRVGVVVAAGMAALLYPWTSVSWKGFEILPGFLALATMAVCTIGLRIRISSTALLYMAMAVCVGMGYVLPLEHIVKIEVPW